MRLKNVDKDKLVSNDLIEGLLVKKDTTSGQATGGNAWTRYNITIQDGMKTMTLSSFKENGGNLVHEGDKVSVVVSVNNTKGTTYFNYASIQKIESQDDYGTEGVVSSDKYQPALEFMIGKLVSPKIKRLVEELIDENFKTSVGGLSIHHGYKAGLLQHSLAVAYYSINILPIYTWSTISEVVKVDEDILIAGALLHDVGKTVEYKTSKDGAGEMSDVSALETHIISGIRLLERKAAEIGIPINDKELTHLIHIISSHHGKGESGSPTSPATPEAIIVHMADGVDFRLNNYDKETLELKPSESLSKFVGNERFKYYNIGGEDNTINYPFPSKDNVQIQQQTQPQVNMQENPTQINKVDIVTPVETIQSGLEFGSGAVASDEQYLNSLESVGYIPLNEEDNEVPF